MIFDRRDLFWIPKLNGKPHQQEGSWKAVPRTLRWHHIIELWQLALAEADDTFPVSNSISQQQQPLIKDPSAAQKGAVMAVFATILGHLLSSPYMKGEAFPAAAERQLVEELCKEHSWVQN